MLGLGMFALVAGGGGIVGLLYATGYLSWGPSTLATRREDRTGQIAYPALARPVTAYATLTRDDLLQPTTRELNVIWLPQTVTTPAMLRDLSLIVGRVLSRDKPAGMILTEADFLPKGTRPGLVAGIPAGQRALSVKAGAVAGLHLLKRGDRFDILSASPADEEAAPAEPQAAALQGGLEPQPLVLGALESRSGVRLLVRAGQMIADGATAGENTVAIQPEEVAPLTAALAANRQLFSVARSGRPDETHIDEDTGPDLTGMVAIPASVAALPALTKLRPDHLADPASGLPKLFHFAPEKLDPAWLREPKQLIGRVLAVDVGPGHLFTEGDFLPTGTAEGVAGGVPAGKLALIVAVDRLPGISELRRGDRFDLLAAMPVDLRRELPQLRLGLGQETITGRERLIGSLQRRATIQVLAEDATLVAGSEAGERRTIAVAPQEVVPVTKALSLGIEVVCVARSGQPADGLIPRISVDRSPAEQLQVIEQITGRRRELEVFATGEWSAVEAGLDTMRSPARPSTDPPAPARSAPSP
jgi:Flp pilus assembly protein CpaB